MNSYYEDYYYQPSSFYFHHVRLFSFPWFRVTELTREELSAHFFVNSLFYERLCTKYDAVPLSKENIFEKNYIIIPCHISRNHWALIVVCNPKNIVNCTKYVGNELQLRDREELKKESASFILIFDSMNNKTVRYAKKLLRIRVIILRWLIKTAENRAIFGINHVASLVKKTSLPRLVLPVLRVDGSKCYYAIDIRIIC